uniref:hypothetical protein n=1 Tax=Enterobacter hormaechei TaxID=158836 RepID=UPI001C3EA70E
TDAMPLSTIMTLLGLALKKMITFPYITLYLFVIVQGKNVPEAWLLSIFCSLWEIKASNILP